MYMHIHTFIRVYMLKYIYIYTTHINIHLIIIFVSGQISSGIEAFRSCRQDESRRSYELVH